MACWLSLSFSVVCARVRVCVCSELFFTHNFSYVRQKAISAHICVRVRPCVCMCACVYVCVCVCVYVCVFVIRGVYVV